jgi:hypothetical protein
MSMLVTTARPTVLGIARRAWGSLIQAAPRMVLLFVIAYALMAGLDVAVDRLATPLAIPTADAIKDIIKSGRRLPWLGVSQAIGKYALVILLRALIAAPLAVAMHRFILLGETRRLYVPTRISLRFSLWLAALQVPVIIIRWLMLFASQETALVPMLVILLIALLLFLMQTLQLFPGLAVEERSPDVSARLETALERAEGMFWLTLLGLTLTFLPVLLAQAVAVRAFAKLAAQAPLIVPFAQAAAGFMLVVLTAAAMSWLYSYGAHRKNGQQAGVSSAS